MARDWRDKVITIDINPVDDVDTPILDEDGNPVVIPAEPIIIDDPKEGQENE